VYGFDVPEAYAILKDGRMYYAFYAPQPSSDTANTKTATRHWAGEVELRGLSSKSYRDPDYVHHSDLGTVAGPNAKLKVDFTDNLLLEATAVP
jgi:alpha-galactosidase